MLKYILDGISTLSSSCLYILYRRTELAYYILFLLVAGEILKYFSCSNHTQLVLLAGDIVESCMEHTLGLEGRNLYQFYKKKVTVFFNKNSHVSLR